MSGMLDMALAAHETGLCVLPPREDGSKRPDAASWAQYQKRLSTEAEIRAWYAGDRAGIGLVCGKVSGIEMLEFEGRAVADGLNKVFRELADAAGLGELLDRIQNGYSEKTPGGGYHLLYHVPTPLKDTRLAKRTATEVLIETRGEGGYCIVAPSRGSVHETGKPWEMVLGSFATIATIADDERDELFRLARLFDQMPPPEPAPDPSGPVGDRPGDRYNAAPDVQERTLELLVAHGWTNVYSIGGTIYLRRPGKDRGISATLGYVAPGVFHVFTTSTEFEARAYLPFTVYAKLEHAGDFSAAGKKLEADGSLGYFGPALTSQQQVDPAGIIVGIDAYRDGVPTEIPWICKPLTYLGGVTLLAGPPKSGKSTLAANLQRCRETGERLLGAWDVASGPTLLVTEEGGIAVVYKTEGIHALDVLDRRAALRAGATFPRILETVERWAETNPRGLAFIDTVATWASIEDENDAAKVTSALDAITALAQRAEIAVDLVHHTRKGGGEHGEAIRGSGAMLGTVDIGAELTYTGDDRYPDERYLSVQGRVILPERYRLDFDRATRAYGMVDASERAASELEDDLAGVPVEGQGLTRDDLRNLWGKDPRKQIEKYLRAHRLRVESVKTGSSHVLRYWKLPAHSLWSGGS